MYKASTDLEQKGIFWTVRFAPCLKSESKEKTPLAVASFQSPPKLVQNYGRSAAI